MRVHLIIFSILFLFASVNSKGLRAQSLTAEEKYLEISYWKDTDGDERIIYFRSADGNQKATLHCDNRNPALEVLRDGGVSPGKFFEFENVNSCRKISDAIIDQFPEELEPLAKIDLEIQVELDLIGSRIKSFKIGNYRAPKPVFPSGKM